jgi:chorismate mutase
MDHPNPAPQIWLQQLEDCRRSIDDLDGSLIAILAERFRLTEEIGRLKATHGVQATDSKREGEQREHFRKLASLHGLDEEIALDIMTRIIEHVKARHDALKQGE